MVFSKKNAHFLTFFFFISCFHIEIILEFLFELKKSCPRILNFKLCMWAFQNLMRKQPKWWLKRGKIVKNFKNFLFENDELLKKILLSKKFLKSIKEYAVIFLEFFGII